MGLIQMLQPSAFSSATLAESALGPAHINSGSVRAVCTSWHWRFILQPTDNGGMSNFLRWVSSRTRRITIPTTEHRDRDMFLLVFAIQILCNFFTNPR